MKRAIVMYGSPGAGKGTQANLLAYKFGLIHFDTGKYIEQIVHDPEKAADPIIRRERRFFDAGYLCTPSWALKAVQAQTRRFAKAGLGAVYSGSPRTLYEARGLMPVLERLYGKENILFFSLEVPVETAIKRNLIRERCSVCGSIVIDTGAKLKRCPICMGRLVRRTLDNREAMKERFKEYNERTKPVFKLVKERGHKIIKIDGRPLPEKVFKNILKHI
jgi:adenylate kinase